MQHKIGDLVVCKINKDDNQLFDSQGLIYALGYVSEYYNSSNKYEVVWCDNDKTSRVSADMVDEMKRLIGRMCDGTEKINESGMPKTW